MQSQNNAHTSDFETELPCPRRVKLTIWKWKDFTTAAYQLPDDSFVMSYRQMALKVMQDKNTARKFVEQASLPWLKVQFNSSIWGIVVPMSTVLAYWKHLDESGTETHIAQQGWKAIDEYLAHLKSSPSCCSKPIKFLKAVYDLSILQSSPLLRVLRLDENGRVEYSIDVVSALQVIGVDPQWLDKLRPKTRARLLKKGFAGVSKTDYIFAEDMAKTDPDADAEGEVASTDTIELSDCLAIWEFFAERRYGKAIACLRALAQESLPSRIRKVQKDNRLLESAPSSPCG